MFAGRKSMRGGSFVFKYVFKESPNNIVEFVIVSVKMDPKIVNENLIIRGFRTTRSPCFL